MDKAAYKRKITYIHDEYDLAVLCTTWHIFLKGVKNVFVKYLEVRMLMNKRTTSYPMYFPSNK